MASMDAPLTVPRIDRTAEAAVARVERCLPLTVAIAEHIAAKGGRVADTLRIAGFLKGARVGGEAA